MRNIKELLDKSQKKIKEIAKNIKTQKDMSKEDQFYAKILLKNNFIDENGNLTDEGRRSTKTD